jgi:adenylate kinase
VIYLVVGLSGVGKSAYCQAAEAQVPNIIHVDLDNRIDSGLEDGCHWLPFFEACNIEIETLEREAAEEGSVILVDVGAGFFQVPPHCFQLLSGRPDVITVFDDPDAIFERARRRPNGYWSNRTAQEFRQELTQEWRVLFSQAANRVDVVGLSKEQAETAFVACVRNLVERRGAT